MYMSTTNFLRIMENSMYPVIPCFCVKGQVDTCWAPGPQDRREKDKSHTLNTQQCRGNESGWPPGTLPYTVYSRGRCQRGVYL